MPFKKGDPRAKQAGRKSGAIRRARKQRERDEAEAQQFAAVGPGGELPPPPPEPPLEEGPLGAVRRNTQTLASLAKAFTDDAALGVLVQIMMSSAEKSDTRMRAAGMWLRYTRGEPIDTTAIAQRIMTLEGAPVDASDLELPNAPNAGGDDGAN